MGMLIFGCLRVGVEVGVTDGDLEAVIGEDECSISSSEF